MLYKYTGNLGNKVESSLINHNRFSQLNGYTQTCTKSKNWLVTYIKVKTDVMVDNA